MFSLTFIVLLPATIAQQLFTTSCNEHVTKTKQNFDLEAYLGKWYEISRYVSEFQKEEFCVTSTFTLLPNRTLNVLNEMIYWPNKEVISIEGIFFEENPGVKDGRMLVKFPINPKRHYWVVDTDYTNFTIVWSCYDLPKLSQQYLWIFARKNILTPEVEATVDAILQKYSLNKKKLRKTTTSEEKCGIY